MWGAGGVARYPKIEYLPEYLSHREPSKMGVLIKCNCAVGNRSAARNQLGVNVTPHRRIQMSKINHTAAFAALDQFAAAGDTARVALVAALVAAGIATREDAYPIVTAWAAAKEMFTWDAVAKVWVSLGNCGLIDGQKAAKGTKVLNSAHPAYEAAKTTRRRAMDAFAPAEKPATKTEAESAATVKPATKAEREAFAALQAAREALKAAEAAFALVCGSKARAKALDAALSA